MSDKYTGEKCIVCGELFADGDDIVVCPDCGTPCHRSCWEKSGECTNTALHESGESWKPTAKVSYTPPTVSLSAAFAAVRSMTATAIFAASADFR